MTVARGFFWRYYSVMQGIDSHDMIDEESVDPQEIRDYVEGASGPLSDLDVFKEFKVSLEVMIWALSDPGRKSQLFYRYREPLCQTDMKDVLWSSEKLDDSWRLFPTRPSEQGKKWHPELRRMREMFGID